MRLLDPFAKPCRRRPRSCLATRHTRSHCSIALSWSGATWLSYSGDIPRSTKSAREPPRKRHSSRIHTQSRAGAILGHAEARLRRAALGPGADCRMVYFQSVTDASIQRLGTGVSANTVYRAIVKRSPTGCSQCEIGGARLVREHLLSPVPILSGLQPRCLVIGEHNHKIAGSGSAGGLTHDIYPVYATAFGGNGRGNQDDMVRLLTFSALHRNTPIAEVSGHELISSVNRTANRPAYSTATRSTGAR
jgi:hypothetical protein